MRLLYSALLYLLTPLILLRWLWRSRRLPAYRQHWGDRLGWVATPAQTRGLWIHAVSVGEVQAVLPLLRRVRAAYPALHITVSTTTPTGAARLRAEMGESVQHCYAPLDTPFAVARALRRLQPKLLVLVETELWPNLLHQCRGRGVAVAMVNARLSERSATSYARWPSLVRPMMNSLQLLIAQDTADAQRFVTLGLPENRMKVSGNLKYDIHISETMRAAATVQREQWGGAQRSVLLAASTHPGEEDVVLAAFRALRERHPTLLLVLVPRHVERGAQISATARSQGWQVSQRSASTAAPTTVDVVVADTLGELPWLLGATDAVVIGGTFIQHGGQNPLEAAIWAKPVVCGPSTYNFSQIVSDLRRAGALLEVSDAVSLASIVDELLRDEPMRLGKGNAAARVVAQHRGASERSMAWLRPLLET